MKNWNYFVLSFSFVGILNSCSSQLETSANVLLPPPGPTGQVGVDTLAPLGSVTINNGSDSASVPGVTVQLTATDAIGVAAYLLSESPTLPDLQDTRWQSTQETKTFQKELTFNLTAIAGIRTLYVWFKDQAGNISTITSDSITLLDNGDQTDPTVQITLPTGNAQYATTQTVVTVGGTASDDVGVIEVTWSNDRGGHGTATGTTAWTISEIPLQPGINIITITASDAYTNTATDSITVTCNSSVPSLAIGDATAITETGATLNATVNPQGASTTAYFEYGTSLSQLSQQTTHRTLSSSTSSPLTATLTGLVSGRVYYFRAVATNSAGTQRSQTSSFTTLSNSNVQYACTQIMGFSQTSGWFRNGFEEAPGIDGSRWQFLGHPGAGVEKWLNIDFSGWTDQRPDAFGDWNYHDTNTNRWVPECPVGAETPDRIVFTISSTPTLSNILSDFPTYNGIHPKNTVADWVPDMKAAIQMFRTKYPSVRQIILQPLVGGPNHTVCTYTRPDNTKVAVRASVLHPTVDLAIAQVVNDLRSAGINDVVAGFSPEVRTCDDYSDDKGHLTGGGYSAVARAIGTYYGSN